MIFKNDPKNWHDLEEKVARIFSECGCKVDIENGLKTIRGLVNIDVRVVDSKLQHPLLYLCECKYWNKAVPKNVVHAFRTVVQDVGAHVGYVISKKGFQSGAHEAALNTNILLLGWHEFQSVLLDRWITAKYETLYPDLNTLYDDFYVPFMERIPGTSMISFVKGKTEISLNFPNCHR
ncbi:MAG: restriction endonuclease [Desulfuromonadales bacterium]|nr:restriction endonuclease [Desulfuromonadales bacterium]